MFWRRGSIEFLHLLPSFLFLFFFFFLLLALGKWNQEKLGIAIVLRGRYCVCVCRYACMRLTRQALNGPAKPTTPSLPCFPSLPHHFCSFNSHSTNALLFTPHPAPTPPLYSPASTLGEQSQRKCDNRGISQMYIQLARVNAVLSHCAAL